VDIEDLNIDYLFSELDEEIDDIKFHDTESSASFFLKDVKYIMFGGFNSRFWMLRKDIISTPIRD
jgi:hypothetical protein